MQQDPSSPPPNLHQSQGAVIGNTGNLRQDYGDDVDTGGGEYIKGNKTVSIFSGLTTREMFSLQIVRRYEQLWGLMEPFAEYANPKALTYGDLRNFAATLRQWYFQDAGGLYMRQFSAEMPTREAYMALQNKLLDLLTSAGDTTTDTQLSSTHFDEVKSAARAVRYALSSELTVFVSQRSKE
jgi:hypothetical protein